MQSSAGTINPHLRAAAWLAGLVLAALVLAVGFGLLSTLVHQPAANTQDESTAQSTVQKSTSQSLAFPMPHSEQGPMWALLEPWVYALDAAAIVGLGIVIAIRRGAQQ